MRSKRPAGIRHECEHESGMIDVSEIRLGHFQAMVLFAVVISLAFGFLSRRRPMDRVKYIVWSLFLFLAIGIGIGWAMYPFSR
jgi:NhaP-type Na+/H+ or K+/H+ antiporter